jgi:phosphohistidine phosphatase SixA
LVFDAREDAEMRRSKFIWRGVAAVALLAAGPHALAQQADGWSQLQPGRIVLFRHALAPGGGDPPGFQLNDCTTQRNLSEEGRAQAWRIGQAFATRRVAVGAVWSSQWCRTRETADIAFPKLLQDQPAFNSFFSEREASAAQTAAARRLFAGWSGPGVLVVVTHQVNITALTGVVPASGEGVVVRLAGNTLEVMGRITP